MAEKKKPMIATPEQIRVFCEIINDSVPNAYFVGAILPHPQDFDDVNPAFFGNVGNAEMIGKVFALCAQKVLSTDDGATEEHMFTVNDDQQ